MIDERGCVSPEDGRWNKSVLGAYATPLDGWHFLTGVRAHHRMWSSEFIGKHLGSWRRCFGPRAEVAGYASRTAFVRAWFSLPTSSRPSAFPCAFSRQRTTASRSSVKTTCAAATTPRIAGSTAVAIAPRKNWPGRRSNRSSRLPMRRRSSHGAGMMCACAIATWRASRTPQPLRKWQRARLLKGHLLARKLAAPVISRRPNQILMTAGISDRRMTVQAPLQP
jgi:hypothetical protein